MYDVGGGGLLCLLLIGVLFVGWMFGIDGMYWVCFWCWFVGVLGCLWGGLVVGLCDFY